MCDDDYPEDCQSCFALDEELAEARQEIERYKQIGWADTFAPAGHLYDEQNDEGTLFPVYYRAVKQEGDET